MTGVKTCLENKHSITKIFRSPLEQEKSNVGDKD